MCAYLSESNLSSLLVEHPLLYGSLASLNGEFQTNPCWVEAPRRLPHRRLACAVSDEPI